MFQRESFSDVGFFCETIKANHHLQIAVLIDRRNFRYRNRSKRVFEHTQKAETERNTSAHTLPNCVGRRLLLVCSFSLFWM